MSEPFLAEVRIFGFNFPPRGWASCDGQILPINQNQSLYSLLGTTYGGDGRTSFALPDLRGRAPIHTGDGRSQGNRGGAEFVALTTSQMPAHNHTLRGSLDGASGLTSSPNPGGNVLADSAPNEIYHAPSNLVQLSPTAVSEVGGQSHNNMQPYTVLHFCIALQGVFPSRN
jgi:microcystin-dependent protein